MNEPIYVTKPAMPPLDEYMAELSGIWDSRILTNTGPKHQALEAALCKFFGVPYFYLFTNGHLALEAALQVLNLPRGSEVITTPFTFVSTSAAIARMGLTPVFCDVKDGDGTMNPALIESLITPRTRAIMPVHVYGNLCDTDEIDGIAARHGLKVVYDAAHAFSVTRKADGKSAGVFGDISMFSFHATKVFHTFEGGGLAFSNPEFAAKLAGLRNFGFADGEVAGLGGNGKMSEAHAAMGLCNLRHVGNYIAERRRVFELYTERLSDCPGIKIIAPDADINSNYSYFPIRVDAGRFGKTRDEVCEALAGENIYARKYFYPLTSAMPIYREQSDISATPVAAKLADEVLTLPLYPDLDKADADRICEAVLRSGKR